MKIFYNDSQDRASGTGDGSSFHLISVQQNRIQRGGTKNRPLFRFFFAGLLFLTLLAACRITASAGITFDRASVHVLKGETRKLGISCSLKKYKVYSSNRSVATVTKKGKVKGVKAGTCNIVVKCAGESASIPVYVMSSIRSNAMTFIGHRGYQDKYPENTLSSFRGALNYGAAGVEFDVWLTYSNDFIIFHDTDLKRLCKKNVSVRDLTAQTRLNYKVKAHKKKDMIPTLDEAVSYLAGMGKIAYIHLKNPHQMIGSAGEDLVECVRRHNMTNRAVVFCADLDVVQWFDRNFPDIKVGYLYRGTSSAGAFGEAYQAFINGTDYFFFLHASTVNYSNVSYVHMLGMKTGLYRTAKKKDILNLMDYGADFAMLYHKLIKK